MELQKTNAKGSPSHSCLMALAPQTLAGQFGASMGFACLFGFGF